MAARRAYKAGGGRLALRVVAGSLLIALVVAGLYMLGRRLEASSGSGGSVRGDLAQRFGNQPTIAYDGAHYTPKKNQTAILFMGVDGELGTPGAEGGFRNGGQADFLLLLLIDHDSKTVSRLQIDRDTMAEITVLGVLGNVSGTRSAQICLAHGFGDGKHQSGALTAEAVQRLLYGAPIEWYVSLSLESIQLINEAVGGVTVPIEDDFSAYDDSLRVGDAVTLTAEQAVLYVRRRLDIGDGSNAARMRRQQRYMTALAQKLEAQLQADARAIDGLLDVLGDVLITNMKRGRLINELHKAAEYEKGPLMTLPGEHSVGTEGFMEFYPEEKALEELVIHAFYQEVSR